MSNSRTPTGWGPQPIIPWVASAIDYHASHAPDRIPGWFDKLAAEEGWFEPRPNPPEPPVPAQLTATTQWLSGHTDQERFEGIDPDFGFVEENGVPAELVRKAEQYFEDRGRWVDTLEIVEAENEARRFFAWRRYYGTTLARQLQAQHRGEP